MMPIAPSPMYRALHRLIAERVILCAIEAFPGLGLGDWDEVSARARRMLAEHLDAVEVERGAANGEAS